MRRPTLAAITVASCTSLILVTGCGSGSSSNTPKDPKGELSAGLSGLTSSDALTLTLKLDTTPDKLQAFAAEGGDKLSAAVAADVASANVVIEVKTDNGAHLGDLKSSDGSHVGFRLQASDSGNSLAELRSVGGALYLQADLKTLLTLFGQAKAYDEVQARAKSLPAFVSAFVAGKWVSLDLSALKALASQFGGAGAAPSTSSKQGLQIVTDLRAALTADVAVTKVGTDSIGDHLRLSGHTKQLATDLMQSVTKDVPSAGLASGKLDTSKITDHTIVLDAWVKDGVLRQISVDVVQFAKPGEAKAGDSLPVVLTFDQNGDDISKPADVTPVDLSQLGTLLQGLGGGL